MGRETLDRSTLLNGCSSRDSRSGSVSSEPNTNWQAPHTFDLPAESFEFLGWGGEECHWELAKFGDDRGHERSRSEGDVMMRGARFQAAGQVQQQPLINLGLGEYPTVGNQAEMRSRDLSREWSTDHERDAEEGNTPFDPTRSKFILNNLPTTTNHESHGCQSICSVNTEGPVMASFALPPGKDHHQSTILSHNASANLPRTNQPILKVSNPSSTLKAKKNLKQGPRTGNNGGRSRRQAPANRECPHCGAKFTRNDRLNYHIDSIHEHKEPKFKCDVPNCSRAFRQRSDLVRHSRHVHHKL
ncbi:hypothetical protein VP01_1481g4 [Puccinia sorghi]|uniref:C2H2-type domain-containing protein n=1 Tax=Puccinia sorghi TaxID=27349 RepID=A0A0L6VJJ8_9BASI|nr:hypothetical protein VP01_1481g4 [Puccinia sorghi]